MGAVISYVQRLGISTTVKEIQFDLKLNKEDMGYVMSAWFFGYAIMQVPSGILADRLGSRTAMFLLAAAWSFFTALTGCAWDFTSLLAIWMAMGMAMAGIFPCATKSISELFIHNNKAIASGMLTASMAFGAAISQIILSRLNDRFPWQESFVLIAVPGFLWGATFFILTKGVPGESVVLSPAIRKFNLKSFTETFKDSTVILLCSQQFFRAMAMVFFFTWFPTYLKEGRSANNLETGNLGTLVLLGAMLGGVLGGFASEKILQITGNRRLARQGIAVGGMSLCAVLVVASYFAENINWAVGFITTGAFFANFGGVSGYTVTIEYGGAKVATVFSLVNMCGNFGAALFPLVTGLILERTGSWNAVVFLFAAIFAIDAIIWYFINPAKPQVA